MIRGKVRNSQNGNYFFYGNSNKGYSSTGFYIHRKWTDKIMEVKYISDRISTLKLKFEKDIVMNIIQVYAPTNVTEPKEKGEVTKFLNTAKNANKTSNYQK